MSSLWLQSSLFSSVCRRPHLAPHLQLITSSFDVRRVRRGEYSKIASPLGGCLLMPCYALLSSFQASCPLPLIMLRLFPALGTLACSGAISSDCKHPQSKGGRILHLGCLPRHGFEVDPCISMRENSGSNHKPSQAKSRYSIVQLDVN